MKSTIIKTAVIVAVVFSIMYAIIYGLLGEVNPMSWPVFFQASCVIYMGFIIICAYDAMKSLEQ